MDTNFVSTILKSDFPDKIIDKERTQALFKKYINPKDNIICISPHTIKELQYNKVFDQFKKIFNIFPFIMLHSFAEIIELEKKGHITKKEKLILTPIHRFMSFDLLDILEHKDTIKIFEKTKENDEGIAEDTLDKYREYINLEGDDRKKKSNAWKITKKAIAEQYGVDETDVNHKKYPARVIFARNQIFKFCNATGQTQKILDRLIKFREDRGWKKYHTLKNLITALQIEASELAEPLLWRDVKEKTDLTEEEKKETAEEAADVFIYLLLIAHKLGLDLDDEVEKKITINEKKYPLEKCTEEFKKHNKL